jgi:hypothetical protein
MDHGTTNFDTTWKLLETFSTVWIFSEIKRESSLKLWTRQIHGSELRLQKMSMKGDADTKS